MVKGSTSTLFEISTLGGVRRTDIFATWKTCFLGPPSHVSMTWAVLPRGYFCAPVNGTTKKEQLAACRESDDVAPQIRDDAALKLNFRQPIPPARAPKFLLSNRMPPAPRSRGWCITWNNPPLGTPEDPTAETFLTEFAAENCKYLVFQLEMGEQMTQHYQGYFYLNTPRTLLGVKRLLRPYQPHLEIARGTPAQNKEYCTKLETRVPGTFVTIFLDVSDPIAEVILSEPPAWEYWRTLMLGPQLVPDV